MGGIHVQVLRLLTFSLVLLSFSAGESTAQPTFDRIVVFGDSLSDTGNAFAVTRTAGVPPDYSLGPLLVPGAPYARGGHHLSNGATWIERLARPLGLAGSVRPAFRDASPLASNYALGAARAREEGINFNLTAQVNAFLQETGGVAPAGALYVIQFGGNDVRDALVAFPGGSAAILQAAVASIVANITTLYSAGATNFLVWNSPDIGATPAVRSLGPAAMQLATFLSNSFNTALAAALAQLSALPGINIVSFDAFGLINEIVAMPWEFGLSNVTDPCVTPNDPPFFCRQPDEYLFWDGIHPTTAVHGIVAQEVALLLGF